MKKILLIGVVVVAGVVVATPKYASSRFEQQLNSTVEKINAAPGYQASIVSNDTGWFSAKTKLQLSLDLASLPQYANQPLPTDLPALATELTLNTKFGPLLFADNALFGLYSTSAEIDAAPLREHLTWPKDKPFAKLVLSESLTHSFYLHDELTPFSFDDDSGRLQLKFSGYQGDGSWVGKQLTYEGNAASFSSEGEFDSSFKGIKLSMSAATDLASVLAGDLYESSTTFSIDGFESKPLQFSDMLFTAANTLDNTKDTSSLQMRYQVGKVHAQDVELSNAALAMNVKDIDNSFIRELQQMVDDASKVEHDPEVMQLKLIGFIQEKLPELLKKSPALDMQLTAEIPQGKFDAKLDSHIDDITAPITPQQLNSEAFWLQHAKAHLNANMDKDVANFIAAMTIKYRLASSPQFSRMSPTEQQQMLDTQAGVILEQLIKTNMLQQKDNAFVVEASVEQGIAKLNGMPIPL